MRRLLQAVDAAKRDAEAAWDRVRVLEAGSHEGLQQLQDELERVKLERDDSHQNCNALESKLKDKDEVGLYDGQHALICCL